MTTGEKTDKIIFEVINMKAYKKILLGLGTVGTGAALGYGACCLIDDLLFKRNMTLPESVTQKISGCDTSHLGGFLEKNLQWVEDHGYEKHSIISDRGEKLSGYLLKAEGESKNYVFCAHGYRSYGKKEFCGVAQYYIGKGYNVFLVDHIASGESEGGYCTFGHYETDDCIKWLSYMIESFGADISIMLHGVSMGSATVMMMSGRSLPENVRGVVADCGFTRAVDLFDYKLRDLGIPPTALIRVVNEVNKKRIGFDFNSLNPVESVSKAAVPMLFIHGDTDALVPCSMVYELYERCASEVKQLLVVEGADHAQSFKVDREKYTEAMDSFLENVFVL